MKKIVVAASVTVLALGLLAGCGKSNTGSATSASEVKETSSSAVSEVSSSATSESSASAASESSASEASTSAASETSTSAASEASSGAESASADTASWKTLADVADYEEVGYGTDHKTFIKVFMVDDVAYRAIAPIPEEVSAEMDKLDYTASDYSEKIVELVTPLEIETVENLTEQQLSEEELSKLAGKTGEELLNDGWKTCGSYYDGTVYMDFGLLQYAVHFDGKLEVKDDDIDAAIKDLAVSSVEYMAVSDEAVNSQE